MRIQLSLLIHGTLLVYCYAAPLLTQDHDEGAFWFGTQDMECLKGRSYTRSKRSVPERSTIDYVHRIVYYRGEVYEWGNGEMGYHYGKHPAIKECTVTWENQPTGISSCPNEVLERYAQVYSTHYGGYNLVLNNCHHFVNRVAIILTSNDCNISRDRWAEFSDKMWTTIQAFVAVFQPGTLDRPQDIQKAESRDPDVHSNWPIVQWY